MTDYDNAQTHAAPHRGTMILVLGILGLVVCVICGIIAWIMANDDLKKMQMGQMDPAGEGLTKAGKILGIVSVVLTVVSLVFVVIMFAAVGISEMG